MLGLGYLTAPSKTAFEHSSNFIDRAENGCFRLPFSTQGVRRNSYSPNRVRDRDGLQIDRALDARVHACTGRRESRGPLAPNPAPMVPALTKRLKNRLQRLITAIFDALEGYARDADPIPYSRAGIPTPLACLAGIPAARAPAHLPIAHSARHSSVIMAALSFAIVR